MAPPVILGFTSDATPLPEWGEPSPPLLTNHNALCVPVAGPSELSSKEAVLLSLPYEKKNVPLAKALRRGMTKWEKRLWYDFLASYPVRFQRQKAIGPYIADFYCHDAALVVELDGKHHYQDAETSQDDLARQTALSKMGLFVLRFANSDLEKDLPRVCDSIHRAVTKRISEKTSP